MIIDNLTRSDLYKNLHPGFATAFQFLRNTDLSAIPVGKYAIDGENIFAIVQEYEPTDTANEQMEAHKKYIDVQYMIQGEERVGHALMQQQKPSKAYDEANDFMLFGDEPSFFSKMDAGTFMIFYPTDMHMPCIKTDAPVMVKKVVVKVAV